MSEWLAANCAQMGYTPVFCEAVDRELARLETQNYEEEPELGDDDEQAGVEEYYTEENMPEINLDEQ